MMALDMPDWVQAIVGILVVLGSLLAFIGALGLARLRSFFRRVHAPALGATYGTWCIAFAMVIYFSVSQSTFATFPFLMSAFVAITNPITSIFLMRTALFRKRQMGAKVPPSLSRR
ncbi:MAG: Na(+)/H(+) antiporter subunit G1 [Paracidovorax wautersii]|uniref:Na(+)/H(+) antiporter subunit G1 n=1 Tax=Paracidovorax wautersii TaxID=1177982 RepID=A0A7V8FMJ6_9BURK|nr:MAG: Na(+)/H(+) antiporter subunit G1 [Paracidovorax wautersii]